VQTHFFDRHQGFKDAFGVVLFVTCVIIGTLFINTFIFRSFNVEGRSMEETMHDGDRLIVNRLPVTWAQLQNKPYVPERGEIIVFKNPAFDEVNQREEYIVKRVIAFEGEQVILEGGHYTVFNRERPEGFNPDDSNNGEPGTPTSGEIDTTVPEGTIFVSGDHRQGSNSLDSRNGLGFIPLYDVIGPVSLRIFPFGQMRGF
jgi:signal peptidase I